MSKKPNKSESAFIDRVKRLPCVACAVRVDHFDGAGASDFHHIRPVNIVTLHWLGIALCHQHHHNGVHLDKTAFRNEFESEERLYFVQRRVMLTRGIWPEWIDAKVLEVVNNPNYSRLKEAYQHAALALRNE